MQLASREHGSTDMKTDANHDTQSSSEPHPQSLQLPFQYNASLHSIDSAAPRTHPTIESPPGHSPYSPLLRLQTDVLARFQAQSASTSSNAASSIEPQLQQAVASGFLYRSSSVRSALSASHLTGGSLSPASAVSSPGLGPIVDITPLPSPIVGWDSPKTWRRSLDSQDPRDPLLEIAELPLPMTAPQELPSFVGAPPKKRQNKANLVLPTNGVKGRETHIYDVNKSNHARNRSISDYTPNPVQILRNRNIVVSGTGSSLFEQPVVPPTQQLHREEYLAIQRGLTSSGPRPPTPPRSNGGTDGSDLESELPSLKVQKVSFPLCYEARTVRGGKLKRWTAVRQLGQGTFSTVVLATSQGFGDEPASIQTLDVGNQSIRRSLVAVKVCEYGPAGGADEKKIETSLKRELDILKAIDHPSLVHLKAFNMLDRRAFLVLNYSPGGDLFEVANVKPSLLTASLIRRIFTELVGAVLYLHERYIVHRDIKLENVLVNISTKSIAAISDWQSHSCPIVTLTDLGLGRWIPKPPESPLLETRCGSEDYAAPELLLGQPYDGRVTDAWALGVLLYAIMEERLPFDQLLRSKRKSQKSHRIARCEWSWVKWGNEDGEWNHVPGAALEGARAIVEGLLVRSRSRWPLNKVAETEWVKGGITFKGPLQRVDDDDDDDVDDENDGV